MHEVRRYRQYQRCVACGRTKRHGGHESEFPRDKHSGSWSKTCTACVEKGDVPRRDAPTTVAGKIDEAVTDAVQQVDANYRERVAALREQRTELLLALVGLERRVQRLEGIAGKLPPPLTVVTPPDDPRIRRVESAYLAELELGGKPQPIHGDPEPPAVAPEPVKCVWCGAPFVPDRWHPHFQCCSDACRGFHVAHKQKLAREAAKREGDPPDGTNEPGCPDRS